MLCAPCANYNPARLKPLRPSRGCSRASWKQWQPLESGWPATQVSHDALPRGKAGSQRAGELREQAHTEALRASARTTQKARARL